MDEIISVIADRLGLDEGIVGQVVEAVFGFLKDNPDKALGLLGDLPGLGEISGLRDLEEIGSRLGKLFGG